MKFLIFIALATLVTFSAAKTVVGNATVAAVLGRIWQGSTAASGQFPYAASLGFCTATSCTMCTGALIGPEWILTVAHCLLTEGTIHIYLGTVSRSAPAISLSVPYTNAIKHPGYRSGTRHSDIALVQIPAVTMSSTVKAVKVPAYSTPLMNYELQTGTIMGWGAKTNNGGLEDKLQYGSVQIRNQYECGQTTDLIDSFICAKTSSSALCGGDDGAPLVVDDTLVGLGSYQVGTCNAGTNPAVFVRVSSFCWWVKKVSGVSY